MTSAPVKRPRSDDRDRPRGPRRLPAGEPGGDLRLDLDPFESISNFFDSGWWSAISLMLQVFVVLLWLALVYWTYQDARRRFEPPAAIAGCVALSVLPFLGSIIYLIAAPWSTSTRPASASSSCSHLSSAGSVSWATRARRSSRGCSPARARPARRPGPCAERPAPGGLASQDEVRDLDLRLTELEFRMRLGDGAPAATPIEDGAASRPQESEREVSETTGGRGGDTGRAPRWRRVRREPEAYD